MKLYISLILTAVLMAFASGYFSLYVKRSYQVTDSDLIKINHLKREFLSKVVPITSIDFSSLYPGREHLKLITPIYTVIEFKLGQKPLFASSRECFKSVPREIISSRRLKELLWEEYRCGKRKRLPRQFFRRPPYLHSSGSSYVYLAYLTGQAAYEKKKWISSHLDIFHVLELQKVKPLRGYFEILATLDNENLQDLGKGNLVINSSDYLFVKSGNTFYSPLIQFFGSSMVKYKIYERSRLDLFLQPTAYSVKNHRRGQGCFYKDGQLCWEYNIGHLFQLANKTNIILFGISLSVIFLVVWMLLSRIRLQRSEEERKRLALQVLTHEFRTPISSLLIMVEHLNDKYDGLDSEMQELVLRLSSEIYRLQRLTESSRNYLRLQHKKQLIELRKEELPSINNFFEEQLDGFEELELEVLSYDKPMTADPYWLMIALKNIIENGYSHGKKPIKVKLNIEEENLMIKIQDSGTCEFDLLEKMSGEFIKGTSSKGTGLGLNIVVKIVESFKGKLTFSPEPSTFILTLPIGGIRNG